MDESKDFIQCLGQDASLHILKYLDDPSDLVRTSAVSSSWRQFVIAHGLCKKLCLKKFPEASTFARVIEMKNMVEPVASEMGGSSEWACLETEHRVYASLNKGLTSFRKEKCISDAICASSTDNYPEESIKNTLEASAKVEGRASYWSSKGESNPAASETLIYKLLSKLCLISEVHVHPFQAYFQYGFPIYSAKSVRFHVGHSKVPLEVNSDDDRDVSVVLRGLSDDKFVWTYSSPEFPMSQENCLQKFKLPEPVLCIGGILKVELLGRVQAQEMDRLYYICITHVQVVGRPLSPMFDIGTIDEGGRWTLKYNSDLFSAKPRRAETSRQSHFHRFSGSIRTWEQMILNSFRLRPVVIEDDASDSDSDSDSDSESESGSDDE